jgi:branched-chain amino acid aminotransferase
MKQIDCFPNAFFEGNIVPIEEAKVSIMTNALQYGTGVFAGIRGYLADDGKTIHIFRLADHYKRFMSAFRIFNVEVQYSAQQLAEKTVELVRKNAPTTDCYIRPLGYAANLGLSPDLSKAEMDVAIYMIPLGEYLPLSRGLKLMVSSWTRITDNVIPSRSKATGGYINLRGSKRRCSTFRV